MLSSSHTSAVAVALCVTVRARRETERYTMRHYMKNQLQPIPRATAPPNVCETFALARGVVPLTTTVGALLANRRQHSSFAGSPKEFLRDIEHGPALVFFYKPVCEPCKVIRERLIHTVSHPIEAMRSTPASLSKEGGDAPGQDRAAPLADGVTSPSEPTLKSDAAATTPSSSPGDSQPCAQYEALSVADILSTSTNAMTSCTLESADADEDTHTHGLSEEDAVICHRIKKQLQDELREYTDRIRIVFVDTNANPRVTALHDIRSLPTFVAYVQGRPLGRVEGAHEEELMTLLRRLVDAAENGNIEPDGTL